MKLGLRIIDSASTINNLKYLNQLSIETGETATVRFQLVDLDTVRQQNLLGDRYMPASGATLEAVIQSVDSAGTVTKSATQPFSLDPSIWEFSLTALETQSLGGTNLRITLTEGSNIKKGLGQQVILVSNSDNSRYQC
jgi:hypothetical protein